MARLPRLVEMKREVEIDTRQEVISSMEGSSFPGRGRIVDSTDITFFGCNKLLLNREGCSKQAPSYACPKLCHFTGVKCRATSVAKKEKYGL